MVLNTFVERSSVKGSNYGFENFLRKVVIKITMSWYQNDKCELHPYTVIITTFLGLVNVVRKALW